MSNQFYVNQQKLTRASELVMLRKLHALECTANGTPLVSVDTIEAAASAAQVEPSAKTAAVANPIPALIKQVAEQADTVKNLKATKADAGKIKEAVATLLDLKQQLKTLQEAAEAVKKAAAKKQGELRAGLEDILLRKFFYVPSFEIYGGVGGLYDFGPTGCALKANIIDYWRQHFVLAEKMLEVSCSALTPDIVLRTSGHVEKFTDFMVKDVKTGDCHRADKLLEDHIDDIVDSAASEAEKKEMLSDRSSADAFSQEELGAALKKWKVKAPTTGNDLSDPFPFNLMFVTSIGPTGKLVGYMRPETAQGIFVNFRRLLEYNGGRMPFAAAQIGLAYRNEISPRSGLLRVREFPLAEIEHFVNPDNKNHPKFKFVANQQLTLLPKAAQDGQDISVQMTVKQAVAKGIIDNETLGYYMARTHLFLTHCGVHADKLRFRQHKDTEMAHYAKDCWDAEILMSYGWVECVGHADRAAYDLQVHSDKSKTDLIAQESYDQPRVVEVASMKLNSALIGKTFGKGAKVLQAYLKELNKADSLALKANLEKGPHTVSLCTKETFEITPEMVTITKEKKTVHVIRYIPSVVEPSFGVGRIMYGILEHSYNVRVKNGEKQGILSLSPSIAPIKASIFPLASGPDIDAIVNTLESGFVELGLSTKSDSSGASIGRKYARSDEVGVPFAITIDFESVASRTVTVRDRDSTTQIRVTLDEVLGIIADLVAQTTTWKKIYAKYPHQEVPEEKEEAPAQKEEKKEEKKEKKKKAPKAKKQVDPRAKLLAKVEKEGGKKAQDIAGMRDMGGVKYFHVAVEGCDADFELMEVCMKAFNAPCPEDADERRGGAEDIGKVLLSYTDAQIAIYMHVPKNLSECSITEWFGAMCAGLPVEMVGESTAEYMKGVIKQDQEKGIFPIKIRDDLINKGYSHLASKQLVMPDDDDEDEMVFGDDDFMM